jgi:integrase
MAQLQNGYATKYQPHFCMPKKRKYELIRCTHFKWRLSGRKGTFYADGRSNQPNAGRHSLDTRDKDEARRRIVQLDVKRAAELGLIPQPEIKGQEDRPLALIDGLRLYEAYLSRPRVTGGAGESTRKRYRPIFDKFLKYADTIGFKDWNHVDKHTLEDYAAHLIRVGYRTPRDKRKEYCEKTLHEELSVLKRCIGWLVDDAHIHGEKIKLILAKAESERPYCWTVPEVAAMVGHCEQPKLRWLCGAIIGLACTGLRISELASLRWSDIDLQSRILSLTDESAHRRRQNIGRRKIKSRRSRSFPIHPNLLDVLQQLPRFDIYVFHGPRRGRLKPDTVRNVLIDKVLIVLAPRFPSRDVAKGFIDGRLHSFRHYFCSRCANSGIPERMVMEWLGHRESAMVRHYYHLHDEEAQRQMKRLNLLGEAGKRFAGNHNGTVHLKTEDSPGRESSSKS